MVARWKSPFFNPGFKGHGGQGFGAGQRPQLEMESIIKVMASKDDRIVLHSCPQVVVKSIISCFQSEAAKLPKGRIIFGPAVMPNEIVAYIDIGIYILPHVN
jgi:hypothetical protein